MGNIQMNNKKKILDEIKNDLKIQEITDSESVKMLKRDLLELLNKAENYKKNPNVSKGFYDWGDLSIALPLQVGYMRLMRITSYFFLKKEQIKNYLLYLEGVAVLASEIEKSKLRIKWRACNRWLKQIEDTGNSKIPAPIELLKD